MSMSIGQLVKGMIGDAQPGEGKALELKVGQTVRGVLVKMTGDGEGIVQINGTPVQAKLETQIEPGQAVLLQVQPESADGALVLKPADPKGTAMPEASTKDWIKALGLPDTKASAELVNALRKDGVVLTREVAGQFKEALAAMPAGGDAASWMRASALAYKRGLPMTGATIGALQQVLAGPPAHALLEALEAGLAAWGGTSAGMSADGTTSAPSAAQAAAAKLQSLLAEGAAIMGEAQKGDALPSEAGKGAGTGDAEAAARRAAGAGGLETRGAGAGAAADRAGTGAPTQSGIADVSDRIAQLRNAARAQAGLAIVAAHVTPNEGEAGTDGAQRASGQPAPNGTIGTNATGAANREAAIQHGTAKSIATNAGNGVQSSGMASNTGIDGGGMERATAQDKMALSADRQAKSGQTWNQSQVNAGATQQSGGTAASAASQSHSAAGGNWVGQLMKWMGVDHERLLANATIMQGVPNGGTTAAGEDGNAAVPQTQSLAAAAKEQTVLVAAGHNHAASLTMAERNLLLSNGNGLPAILPGQLTVDGEGAKISNADTLKSTLLAIASGDDVPPQLKDAAQQLISHITGQQLLLAPEKNGALLSHVTMFIPMKGADGNQTASVHIQARRGRKGELDGDNCRLLFDLRMKSLGDTVIDVQVVNKIVNLQVWNDHPLTSTMVEASRDELSSAIAQAGYQLLTFRTAAMPERLIDRLNGEGGFAAAAIDQDWSSKPYKGVDIRV